MRDIIFKHCVLVVASVSILCVPLSHQSDELRWDYLNLNDRCIQQINVPAVPFLKVLQVIMRNMNPNKGFYLPIMNEPFHRWIYEKVTNRPATSIHQLNALEPMVRIPDVDALPHLSFISYSFAEPANATLQLFCVPTHAYLARFVCEYKYVNKGGASLDFGGNPIPVITVWADETAWADWRCFEGNRQVYVVFSVFPFLTQQQININYKIAMSLGFNPNNLVIRRS